MHLIEVPCQGGPLPSCLSHAAETARMGFGTIIRTMRMVLSKMVVMMMMMMMMVVVVVVVIVLIMIIMMTMMIALRGGGGGEGR